MKTEQNTTEKKIYKGNEKKNQNKIKSTGKINSKYHLQLLPYSAHLLV